VLSGAIVSHLTLQHKLLATSLFSVNAGKVEIGAFRTYPADYTPPNAAKSEYQPIPLNKIEDFGVHADRYYQLDLSIFKTSLDSRLIDLLWNKYWVNTLASSPLLASKGFVAGQLDDASAPFCRASLQELLSYSSCVFPLALMERVMSYGTLLATQERC
jgi:hypothetical protein